MSDKKVSNPPLKGKVMRRKKTKQSVLSESVDSAFEYVLENIILPAAKDLISDTVSNIVDTMLYGQDSRDRRNVTRNNPRGSAPMTSRTNYNGRSTNTVRPAPQRTVTAAGDVDEIIFETRQDAEQVLDALLQLIATYDVATLSDYYGRVNITPKFTDEKWGWYALPGSYVKRVRNGFVIELPTPEYLN